MSKPPTERTAHGDPNSSGIAVINLPVIQDTLAVRAVVYDDHRGGYVDNMPSNFTRLPSSTDPGPASFGLHLPGEHPGRKQLQSRCQGAEPHQL